jgi:hypothetical protein
VCLFVEGRKVEMSQQKADSMHTYCLVTIRG